MDKTQLEEGLELAVQFEKRGGIVPVIVQDASSGQVLMLAYANRAALEETLKSGDATFWSTSRNQLWTKGGISGNRLRVDGAACGLYVDCDQDALIYRVERIGGGACHTRNSAGRPRISCFYRKITDAGGLEFIE
ncbi:phosphoribosyl-AMP cyclohydrolase [Candidatus Woesearchaeota archaeon]|nr:phosphoribosyl-AMP cyclohydrolase [Candidatus Woesearchaeota archaeon]